MLIPTKCKLCGSKNALKHGVCLKCERVFRKLFELFCPSVCSHWFDDFGRVIAEADTSGVVLTFGGPYQIPWFKRKLCLSLKQVESSLKDVYEACLEVARVLPKVCKHQEGVCDLCKFVFVEFVRFFVPRAARFYVVDKDFVLDFLPPHKIFRYLLGSRIRLRRYADWSFDIECRYKVPHDHLVSMVERILSLCLEKVELYLGLLQKYFRC